MVENPLDISKTPITNRKDEHIYLVSQKDVESKRTTMLENVEFVHKTLPELDLEDIKISTEFLEKKIASPLIIGAMTGGTNLTKKINIELARAAQKFSIPMMVGSQRVILKHPETKSSFSIIREHAPDVPIVGNIGLSQIATSTNFDYIQTLIDNIQANAIAIHLNAIQEVIQPEGDMKFSGALKNISKLVEEYDIPIIIKETGCGISREVAESLFNIGIEYIDVSGVGGTSWVAVEYFRAKDHEVGSKEKLGQLFWDWGIPTGAAIMEVSKATNYFPEAKIIASGGIRTGIDIAKSIRLGANFTAMARPLLLETLKNKESLFSFIEQTLRELKITMLLTGSRNLVDLKKAPIVILGKLDKWIKKRNLNSF